MSEYKMTDPAAILNFIEAGRAVFSIRSEASGAHWTFRITRKKLSEPYFVSLLCNGQDYFYLGYIKNRSYATSNKACRPRTDVAHSVITFLLNNLKAGGLHSQLSFFHEGKCAKCGKPLTDPASIERGLGPTCASRV